MAILTALAFGFYGYLGGFSSPDIVIATSTPQTIVGKAYNGPVEDARFDKLFREMAQAQENKTLVGTLANIYYNNPEEQNGSINAFIGVAVNGNTSVPAGFEQRSLPGGKRVIRVTSNTHFLLAPNKLYPALFDYLQEERLQTKKQYLEKFPQQGAAIVEVELLN